MKLTEEQQRVIARTHGPWLVYAVAGAGKTTCILLHIRKLIERGVHPAQVLLTTFSKRGAVDMARRAVPLGLPRGVEYRTLHSTAWMILQTSRKPGDRRLVVAKNWHESRVVRQKLGEIAKERGTDAKGLPTPRAIRQAISLAKSALVWPCIPGEPDKWKARDGSEYPSFAEWFLEQFPGQEHVLDIYERCYVAVELAFRCPEGAGFESEAGVRLVSFDDMIAMTARAILQGDEWTWPWYERFAHVLVDEVQDNTIGQWIIAEYLARQQNIVVVGDDQQAIFTWRGAAPAQMRGFLTRFKDVTVSPLSYNFRCAQSILDVANAVLKHAKNRLYDGELQRGRLDAGPGIVVGVECPCPRFEARKVIEDVDLSIRDGTSPSDIVILYRLNAQAGALEMELIRRGIPYLIAGSSFFSRGEVKTVIAYLRLVVDETDEVAFHAACNVPTRYLGRAFLEQYPTLKAAREALASKSLGRRESKKGGSSWDEGVRAVDRAVRDTTRILNIEGLGAAIDHIARVVGVQKYFIQECEDDEDAFEVEEALVTLAHCATTLESVHDLLDYSKKMVRSGFEDHDQGQYDSTKRITLSTVHKSKGLEWKNVYVIGVSRGVFPLFRGDPDEERRLGYVAFTRPKDFLHISWCARSASGADAGPSSLIREAGFKMREVRVEEDEGEELEDEEETEPEPEVEKRTPAGRDDF